MRNVNQQLEKNESSWCLTLNHAYRNSFIDTCASDVETVGSAILVKRKCDDCGESYICQSQPKIRQMYRGNLLMSASILFSRALAAKVMQFLDIFGIVGVSNSNHFGHQKRYLHATMHKVWQQEQQDASLVLYMMQGTSWFWQGMGAATAVDIAQSTGGARCWSAQPKGLLMSRLCRFILKRVMYTPESLLRILINNFRTVGLP